MFDKVILENRETFKSVPDCYKNQKICDEAVDNYAHGLEFVSECYKTQKMYLVFLYLILLLIHIKIQICVIKVISKNLLS